MTWQNPWMFGGLAVLALPVLIHLLSRRQAVVQRFPSLRFLDVSRLLPTRSPRLSDIPLLIVRLGILAAAVLALAGPLFNTANRKRAQNRTLARAILVDTSQSVLGAETPVKTLDSLRVQVQRLAGESQTSLVIQTPHVNNAIAGALAWLATQSARTEIVLLSDFQLSAVDSVTIAGVPKSVGVRLIRTGPAGVSVVDSSAGYFLRTPTGVVSVTVDAASSTGHWDAKRDTVTALPEHSLTLLVAAGDRDGAEAARQAASRVAATPFGDSATHVAIVYAGAAERDAIVNAAQPVSERWMANVIARMVSSELLASASASVRNTSDTAVAAPFAVLARDGNGHPFVYGAQSMVGNVKHLVLLTRELPASLASAALIAAVQGATARDWTMTEFEPFMLTNAVLAGLQRAPGEASPALKNSSMGDYATLASDARWFWLSALVLLAMEQWMRNRADKDPALQPDGLGA